jgi:DNA-directed RNA polymerase beta' subunit
MKINKILIITPIIVLILILLYLVLIPITRVEEFALNTIYSTEVKTRFAPNGLIYTGYCNFDLINPVIYSIFNEEDKKQYVIYSAINRESVFTQEWNYEYELNDVGSTLFYNKDFESTKKLYKENTCEYIRSIKDNDDIENYPPITSEEIQADKERQRKNQLVLETEKRYQEEEDRYNKLTTEEKIKYNEEKIKNIQKAVDLLKKGIIEYEDGTTIDSGDLDLDDDQERASAIYFDEEYIKELEAKNEELKK